MNRARFLDPRKLKGQMWFAFLIVGLIFGLLNGWFLNSALQHPKSVKTTSKISQNRAPTAAQAAGVVSRYLSDIKIGLESADQNTKMAAFSDSCRLFSSNVYKQNGTTKSEESVSACAQSINLEPIKDFTVLSAAVQGEKATVKAKLNGKSIVFTLIVEDKQWVIDNARTA